MIKSFGKDPLLCCNCKSEMLLWKIWHPIYGTIFDLSRDGPFLTEEKKTIESRNIKNERKGNLQLSLFPL